MSCNFDNSKNAELYSNSKNAESKPTSKSQNIDIVKSNKNIDDIKKDKVAFSFEKNFEFLEPIQSIPRPIALSSKFSSCSSFSSLTPIHSGRSTPLQFQIELENSVNPTEVDMKS